MQRLTILEFGKSKLILGGEPRSNGFNTTQFLLQLNRLISESGASRYLNGQFRVEDSSLMNNEARKIHRLNDTWQRYKNLNAESRQFADQYEALFLLRQPLPALPAGVSFVEFQRVQHANSLSKRAEKEDNLAKSASLACVGIL